MSVCLAKSCFLKLAAQFQCGTTNTSRVALHIPMPQGHTWFGGGLEYSTSIAGCRGLSDESIDIGICKRRRCTGIARVTVERTLPPRVITSKVSSVEAIIGI